MKKLRIVFAVLVTTLALLSTACNNKAADAPAQILKPGTWFDVPLAVTLEKECFGTEGTYLTTGEKVVSIQGKIYSCGALNAHTPEVASPDETPMVPSEPLPAKKPLVEVPEKQFDSNLPLNLPAGIKIVGNRAFNVCDPATPKDGYPELQIEVLWTDGLERPETLTALDLNRQETGENLYYLFFFPLGSGGHAYDADGHFTYEVHGGIAGTYVLSTAITGWCKYNENDPDEWDSGTEMHPGMVQFHPVDGDICEASAWKWVQMPANGKLPKPNCGGSPSSDSTPVSGAFCDQPTSNNWIWTTRDGASFWFYTGSAIKFTVSTTFDQVHWFFDDGQTQKNGIAYPGDEVTAVTASAFCARK